MSLDLGAISDDGEEFAACSQQRLEIFRVNKPFRRRSVPEKRADAIAFSPDRVRLAVACAGQLRLWDVSGAAPQRLAEAKCPHTTRLEFSPDGKTLASTGFLEVFITLWDGLKLGVPRRLRGHAMTVNAMNFSPWGRTLAAGGTDATVRLWNVATGEEVLVLKGHVGEIRAVRFAPAGNILASVAEDASGSEVILWHAATDPSKGR
jgi:WD40 repeat protein